MKKINTFISIATIVLSSQVSASIITKLESNDTLATAQNIDASFTLDYDVNIGDKFGVNTSESIAHATIDAIGNGTFDYYTFTVENNNAIGIFDIDFGLNVGGSVDTELGLWDASGNVLASNDDSSKSSGAEGSVHRYDAFIQYDFTSAGTYYIGVGRYNSYARSGGFSTNSGKVGNGSTYTLQASVDGHTVDVAEPASLAAFALSLFGLASVRRKKS